MPTDTEKIKKSLDDFEAGNYVDSEEHLKGQVRKSVKDHLRNKLGLQGNPDGSEAEAEDSADSSEDSDDNSEDPDDDSEE